MNERDARPRYLQVCDALVTLIRSDDIHIGDLLPTELDLCERFNVSRHTAREALRRVEAMGLVERRRGSGTRVKAKYAPVVYNQLVDSLDGLLQYGQSTRLVIQSAVRAQMPSELLEGKPGDHPENTVHLTAIRYQRDQSPPLPLCFVDLWAPSPNLEQQKHLLDMGRNEQGLYDLLDFMNLSRVRQTLSAERMTSAIAQVLDAEALGPALVIVRRYFNLSDQLVLLTISTHPHDRFRFTTELTAYQRA